MAAKLTLQQKFDNASQGTTKRGKYPGTPRREQTIYVTFTVGEVRRLAGQLSVNPATCTRPNLVREIGKYFGVNASNGKLGTRTIDQIIGNKGLDSTVQLSFYIDAIKQLCLRHTFRVNIQIDTEKIFTDAVSRNIP